MIRASPARSAFDETWLRRRRQPQRPSSTTRGKRTQAARRIQDKSAHRIRASSPWARLPTCTWSSPPAPAITACSACLEGLRDQLAWFGLRIPQPYACATIPFFCWSTATRRRGCPPPPNSPLPFHPLALPLRQGHLTLRACLNSHPCMVIAAYLTHQLALT